jgi:hypothetical protein
MITLTNQKVYDALNHGIRVRWPIHIAAGGEAMFAPPCLLCDLFEGGNDLDNYGYVPWETCKACPVSIFNDGKACGSGSTFIKWVRDSTPETAKAMRKELKAVKKHFFGDWK